MEARRNGSWLIDPKVYWNGLQEAYANGKSKGFRGVTHSFDKHKLAKRLRERKNR